MPSIFGYEIMGISRGICLLRREDKAFVPVTRNELKELEGCADKQAFDKLLLEIRDRLLSVAAI